MSERRLEVYELSSARNSARSSGGCLFCVRLRVSRALVQSRRIYVVQTTDRYHGTRRARGQALAPHSVKQNKLLSRDDVLHGT